MAHAVDPQHGVAETDRDHELQLARVGLAAIGTITQAGEPMMG